MSRLVAIHQPNYIPWLGYFRKIAMADMFVFHNDVQLPYRSYTRRVRIAKDGVVRWLTQPVRGGDSRQPICDIRFADDNWPAKHLNVLRGAYGQAAHFHDVWDAVTVMYENIPMQSLAIANRFLVEALARKLRLDCVFLLASDYSVGSRRSGDRLVALVKAVATNAVYLSGAGGAKYQDPEEFAVAGVPLRYASFDHPVYPRGGASFHPGLSVLDVVFHLGWDGARALIVDAR